MLDQELLKQIENKYLAMGQDPNAYLKGLLYASPINYWDYIEVDTLLSLQKPRTAYKDEEIFIIYHQVTELVLKLIFNEVKQLTGNNEPTTELIIEKVKRINRYSQMLIKSFDIMQHGMSYDDYNEFRFTLTPASGFQSAQFRFIELHITQPINLINKNGKTRLPQNPGLNDLFEQMYWRDAGLNHQTGNRSLTLSMFEDKYMDKLKLTAVELEGKTLADKVAKVEKRDPNYSLLLHEIREMDQFYNIAWPLVHLRTARHYLQSKSGVKAATGGSDWQKYLHPKYQQRKFFPAIYSQQEIDNWAAEFE